MRAKVHIKDVAAAANVSTSTVSRVVMQRFGYMSEETRRRVQAAIERLGYVPDAHASSLRSRRSNTIGVIITNLMNPFFTAVVRGLQDFAVTRRYELFICNMDDQPEYETRYLNNLLSRKVDGLVVTTCLPDTGAYKSLLEDGYPLVLVDRASKSLRADTVVIDNASITHQVTRKLIDKGHRRIGVITPRLGTIQPRRERVEGIQSAFTDRGIEFDPALLLETPSEIAGGAAAAARLLDMPDRPTALFVLNTFQAIGALKQLQDREISIPRDLSFVMFDDQQWTELIRPRISAVNQPAYEIGKRAGALILERLENPLKPIERVVLDAQYVDRDSVGPAPEIEIAAIEAISQSG